MQVNLHPAFLPTGRGAWPMPVSILKNIPSGMTLHKLEDGQALNAIRGSCLSALSDFTFPLQYCRRKALKLRLLLGKNYFPHQIPGWLFLPGGRRGSVPARLGGRHRIG